MKRKNIALLRGINVGGKNRLPMADLRAIFEDAGCTEVETYIQSGNVVFAAPQKVLEGLGPKVQQTVKVPVVLRTGEELEAAARQNPYLKKKLDPQWLHLVFLADLPDAAAAKGLDPKRSPTDTFVLRGREIYLHCPQGYGNSKLTNAWFDSKLSTVSTVRNWRTVEELLSMTQK